NSAAIASQNAADIYKLKVMEIGINDQPGNVTRFVALGDLKTHPTGRDKTSMIIVLNDKPGALHEALGVLAKNSISMTRLESHPYSKGQYGFYVDFIGHIDEAPVMEAIDELRKITRTCQILGSYPIEAGK
ncbi:MAG TPA: prephenate dehydratase domain-containing protein, partial [Patescibacteria group bacterium]|nr:prephenate dehydratase domain-containing protein [Patescibacteria group bacterium]